MGNSGCYFTKEDGSLWLAVSSSDEYDFVTTEFYLIEDASETDPEQL